MYEVDFGTERKRLTLAEVHTYWRNNENEIEQDFESWLYDMKKCGLILEVRGC